MSSLTMTSNAAASPKGSRKSASLPSKTVEYLKAWMMSPEHVAHPYPTEQEKAQIMAETGIELKQLTNWFVNNRKRYWKPRVEAKLQKKVASVSSLPSSLLSSIGGMTIPLNFNHIDHKLTQQVLQQQGAVTTSLPMPLKPLQAPLFIQGNVTTFGPPTGGAIQVPAAASSQFHHNTHAVSEGSGSSACNSDEDSTSTFSASRRSSLVTSSIQCVDSRLSTVPGAGTPSMSYNCNVEGKVGAPGLYPPMSTIHFVSPLHSQVITTSRTSPLARSWDSMTSADANKNVIKANLPPKKRARKVSSRSSPKGEDEWMKLCQHASSLYCESLPDLEDATQMFGYAS